MKKNIRKDQKDITLLKRTLIGTVAASIEVFINHPLFVIKTRLQSPNLPMTFDPRILYRGVIGNAASMIPMITFQIAFYHSLLHYSGLPPSRATSTEKMLAGLGAGVASSCVATPVELILTKQQLHPHHKYFYQAFREFYYQWGLKALYTGFVGTAVKIALPTAGFLAGVPLFCQWLNASKPHSYSLGFFAGATVGISTACLTQPYDTIKTRQQIVAGRTKLSFYEASKQIYKSNGFLGFFKGGAPRVMRVTSAVAIISLVNEKLSKQF